MNPTPFIATPFGTSSLKTSCSPGRTTSISTSGVCIAPAIVNSSIGTVGVNNSNYLNPNNHCVSGVPLVATSATGLGVSGHTGVSSSGFGMIGGGMNSQHVCQSGFGATSNFIHGAGIVTPNVILPPSPIQTLPPPIIKPILNTTINKSQIYQTFPPIVSTVTGSSHSGIMNPPPSSRGLLPTIAQPMTTSVGVTQITGGDIYYDQCMYQGSQIQGGSQIYQQGSQIYQNGSRVIVSSGCCSQCGFCPQCQPLCIGGIGGCQPICCLPCCCGGGAAGGFSGSGVGGMGIGGAGMGMGTTTAGYGCPCDQMFTNCCGCRCYI